MKPQFALHPGYIRSRSDNDTHYIGPNQLARLYELKFDEYIIWGEESRSGRGWDDYIHLYPRRDGSYGRPDVH